MRKHRWMQAGDDSQTISTMVARCQVISNSTHKGAHTALQKYKEETNLWTIVRSIIVAGGNNEYAVPSKF